MARKPRIEFPGAFYHIIVRGNQRQGIFLDDNDCDEYLRRLQKYKKVHGFNLYAYTLMTNHIHLLMETVQSPISKIMQVLSFGYTQYFNRKYGKSGHLFQGRYKSFLCDRDAYLLELVRYIHLNPVRAGMVKSPDDYRWSSHHQYLKASGGLADVDDVLQQFSKNKIKSTMLYNDFMKEPSNSSSEISFYKVTDQQILGDEEFVDKITEKVNWKDRPADKHSLDKIINAVCKVSGLDIEDILSGRRRSDIRTARSVLIKASQEADYKLTELQRQFKRDLSVLSKWGRVLEEKHYPMLEEVRRRLNAYLQA